MEPTGSDAAARLAAAPSTGAPIVAFDFDGTLTVKDSYTAFLRWRTPGPAWVLGGLRLIPAALAYLVHRDRGRIKAAATKVFLGGVEMTQVEQEAQAFAEANAVGLLRPDALVEWRRWHADGVRRVIVTASPEPVVAPFARMLEADALIGTRLAADAAGRLTGAFATPNCRGPEKVVRIRDAFGPNVRIQAAYGDTSGDTEMLAASESPQYQVFHGRP